jgi:LPXTG-motif cell wall-anchored protein
LKKIIIACTAAVALALAPLTSASALDVVLGGNTWDIQRSNFGVTEMSNDTTASDVFDNSDLSLSVDDGANFTGYECREDSLLSETTIGAGKVVTCDELVTVVTGLNVRGFAYVYSDGLKAAVTYKITNTTGASIPFTWLESHNYGEGQINAATYSSVFSVGDGTNSGTNPAAVAWGPTSQDCSAASGNNDGYDNMEITSESCTLAAGASVAITVFHIVGTLGQASSLETSATALFVTRNDDATLAAGIPSGLVAPNWGLTGTLDVSTVPAAADPFDPTETMTLTGDAVLGNYMTVAFKSGVTPVGDYYDVWMCPNKDVKPVDGAITGDCTAVTFWNRAAVASYNQATSALTMTWQLSNETVDGLIAQGGASYLDGSGEAVVMDPPSEDGGWCAYEGYFMIVNDYDGGAHSNWSPAISATGCSEAAGSGTGSGAELAKTGQNAQLAGLIGLLALLAGLGVAFTRRRGADSL